MTPSRRRMHVTLPALALLAGAAACEPVRAPETGPAAIATCAPLAGETVRWIVPFTAGGGYDVYSRLVEPFFERAIGASVVVENRPGANGWIASRLVRDAAPDGRTIGILQASDLLIDDMMGDTEGLHPLEDFTPLGRIAVAAPVAVGAGGSPFTDWSAVEAADRPLVWGIGGVGGSSWVMYVAFTQLLGVDARPLGGYPGAREVSLGTMRGEADLSAHTFESIRDRVIAGDLVPIAQLSAIPGDYPELHGVPVLGGPEGLAARRARLRGEDPVGKAALADALAGVFEIGRLVVAPRGLDAGLTSCLREGLRRVAHDSAFVAAATRANRTLSYGDPETLARAAAATVSQRAALERLFRRSAEAARSGNGSR